jgi:hypothetical protein
MPAVESTQFPNRRLSLDSFLQIKRPEHKSDHSFTSSAKVNNTWSFTPTSHILLRVSRTREKLYICFHTILYFLLVKSQNMNLYPPGHSSDQHMPLVLRITPVRNIFPDVFTGFPLNFLYCLNFSYPELFCM